MKILFSRSVLSARNLTKFFEIDSTVHSLGGSNPPYPGKLGHKIDKCSGMYFSIGSNVELSSPHPWTAMNLGSPFPNILKSLFFK